MASLNNKAIIFLAFTFAQPLLIACVDSSDHLVDQSHDPFKDTCTEFHQGEYFRETYMKIVCCGNETLRSPDILVQEKRMNPAYAECAQKFQKDDKSDFPTGMWNAFICKLQKAKVFKTQDKLTFAELRTFMTQKYPENVKNELKTATVKCNAIDSEKVADHLKIQKYMECYYEAENKTCHKPYAEIENHFEDVKKTQDLGCPLIPGLYFSSSIEYCCKKRSTPYPIMEYPGPLSLLSEKVWDSIDQCADSFEQREKELMPEVFKVVTPKTDDGEDHQMHSSWHSLCYSACMVHQKNYTKSMLKLDPDMVIDFYTHDFGKAMSDDLSKIIKRRKNKNKIFLGMDVDAEKSQPMNFAELSAKFDKASEKEQIQYYCKFVDTINMEERRAVHEYCINEKHGDEWGDAHHSFFVPSG